LAVFPAKLLAMLAVLATGLAAALVAVLTSIIVVVTTVGTLQPTLGVVTRCRSIVSWTFFFDLGGGDTVVSL
jgi:hypothetical protein